MQKDIRRRAEEISRRHQYVPEDPCTCPLCEKVGLDYGHGWYRCDDCRIEFHRSSGGKLDYLTFNLGGGPSKR